MKKTYFFWIILVTIITLAYVYGASANNVQQKAIIPEKFAIYAVKPGDTLWNLSKQNMPNIDPRRGVREILNINGMPNNYTIRVGDIISIPSVEGTLPEPLGDGYSSPEVAETVE